MVYHLKNRTHYKTGGTCDEIIAPKSIKELAVTFKRLTKEKIPYFLLGAGSNSLVMDDHFPGAVIIFDGLAELDSKGTLVRAQAGVTNTALAEYAAARNLSGAEWMYYLPGQIGGTVRMNASCYGGEMSQIAEKVVAVNADGKIKKYSGNQVFGGYKKSIFAQNGEIVAEAYIRTRKGDPIAIRKRMAHCKNDRESKDHFLHPSCGCVFKNNHEIGVPSGALLEGSGVHGLSTDMVYINPRHANIVFNKGATSHEIFTTTLTMRDMVYEKFGIWLEYEMQVLGQVSDELRSLLHTRKPHKPKNNLLDPLRKKFKK